MSGLLRALWAYRGFVIGSVKREFQGKYLNSLLGATWVVLNPLAMIVVYTAIFASVMKARLPGVESAFGYSIYLCAGVLTWELFSEIVRRAMNVFIENANLLKKISFPRICLPAIVVANSTINFLVIFGIFVAFLVVSGNFPGMVFFAIFPLLFLLVAFAIGLGITLGVLNVFFRDVGQFFGIFITFWFWFTPIVYVPTILDEPLRALAAWNPMAAIIRGFQGIFVSNQWPEWQNLWLPAVLAALLCASGALLFLHHVGEMVDEL